jgi:hypothetical protein
MLAWLTICNSAAAVLSGPVSPNSYEPGSPKANGPASPSQPGNNPSGPLPTGYVPPSTSGSTAADFKYCRCVDGQQQGLNTATNNVYQGYLQNGDNVKLSHDSTGAPIVSNLVLRSFQRPVFSSPCPTCDLSFPLLLANFLLLV